MRDLVDPELIAEKLADRARIHDGAREAEVADLGALLEDNDRGLERLSAVFLCLRVFLLHEPREVERGREARRPRAHDRDIDLERLALDAGKVEGRGLAGAEGGGLRHACSLLGSAIMRCVIAKLPEGRSPRKTRPARLSHRRSKLEAQKG
jgi:hypothetical protein